MQDVPALMLSHVPELHVTHDDDPLTPLYAPAEQAPHCPPSGPLYPALHRQSVTFELPLNEFDRFPAGHSSHPVPALTLRYVPASHATHSDDPLTSL